MTYKKKSFSKNKSNFKPKNNTFSQRYDDFFGGGTFHKLLDAKEKYTKNQFIRINLSKISIEEGDKFLKKNRVKYSNTFISNALKIERSFFNISSSIESISGKVYLQDLASQIPVNCIDFSKYKNKKIRILDMAASPGSKTTQIADLFSLHEIDYEIVALEPENKRLTRLINNIQKQGFENITIVNTLGEDYEDKELFDIVLLDAPCSGNLVGDRDWLKKRDMNGILNNSDLQKKLLKNAEKLTKKEGIMIYSTCSLEVEENELNVDWILKNSKLKSFKPILKFGFDTKPLTIFKGKKLDQGVENSIRIMPYLSKTQGFFVCCFRK
ncbi:MAG: RsmB/NOP family class I SAM-dependent RNA methyltransferase [Candidatus Woesearchaeota archaeon]|jgi:16S rRNA C967 or C1407 C5-methylase (RsmB/RsmF family)|nr:RsmB/NOP family class I SAM-dependent RNA methyltransferase [Candidatus Woesearchaeota archaeon]